MKEDNNFTPFTPLDLLQIIPTLLQLPEEQLYAYLLDYPCTVRYRHYITGGYWAEVRWDSLATTVNCCYIRRSRCSSIHLLPDQPAGLLRYTNLLTEYYPYDPIFHIWRLPTCRARVLEQDDELLLLFAG